MKIGIILESELHSGGGFQQSLTAINQAKDLFGGIYDLCIYYIHDRNRTHLREVGLPAKKIHIGPIDRMRGILCQSLMGKQMARKLNWKSRFEQTLIADGVNLIYFLSPSPKATWLHQLNYIYTVWDVCHQDFPEFPEVRDNFEYEIREAVLDTAIRKAVLTLTDSPELAAKIVTRLGVDPSRLLPMPFSPASHLLADNENPQGPTESEIMRLYGLEPGYLFYPAQFWAHKNHVRIIQALKILQDEGRSYSAVFCGSDKGTRQHVEATAERLGVAGLIKILDFVPNAHMKALYKNASALIMPTYFGPTNIPPLEAWSLGVPVIYSSHLSHNFGGAALSADPTCEHSLARAIAEVTDLRVRESLISAGYQRIQDVSKSRDVSSRLFTENLRVLARMRECWDC